MDSDSGTCRPRHRLYVIVKISQIVSEISQFFDFWDMRLLSWILKISGTQYGWDN